MSVRTGAIVNASSGLRIPRRARLRDARAKLFSKAEKESSLLLLFVLHVPLGVLMYNSSAVAIAHPLAITALGLYWALQAKEPISRVAYVVAYLIGAEVLWRMTGSPIYWEFGKYGSSAIMIAALLRRGLVGVPGFPLLYLVLLIPACYITLADSNWQLTRDRLSFNMSGPICLFACCWFFSQIKLTEFQLRRLLLYLAVPLVSVAIATLFFTLTNPNLEFTNESNPLTSGGFGPNQVSAMLGLGVFLAASALLLFKNDRKTTTLLGILALFFAAQSVLTFSRGGIYAAVGALSAVAIFQARDFGQLLGRSLPVLALAGIFIFLVFPGLNDFTGGKLEERFDSSDTTNRVSIMEMEIQVFLENPVLGAGVGKAIDERYQMSQQFAASHTEFTRLISEHGLFGVLAILFLIAASVSNLLKQTTRSGKAIVAGAVVWSGLFMMNAGMRLAAPAFLWGLSFVLVVGSDVARRGRHQLVQAKRTRFGVGPMIGMRSRSRSGVEAG